MGRRTFQTLDAVFAAGAMAVTAASAGHFPCSPLVREGPGGPPSAAPVAATALPVGEEYLFAVRWGPVKLGEVRLWSEWAPDPAGDRLALRARIRSNRALAAVFALDSYAETLADPVNLRPVVSTLHSVEKGRVREECLQFDAPDGRLRRWLSWRDPPPDEPPAADWRDVLTAVWRFRADMAAGRRPGRLAIAAGPDLVLVDPGEAASESVRVPALGEVACHRFKPAVFRDGRPLRRNLYTIWLAEAPPHGPMRIAVETPSVTLHAHLLAHRRAP